MEAACTAQRRVSGVRRCPAIAVRPVNVSEKAWRPPPPQVRSIFSSIAINQFQKSFFFFVPSGATYVLLPTDRTLTACAVSEASCRLRGVRLVRRRQSSPHRIRLMCRPPSCFALGQSRVLLALIAAAACGIGSRANERTPAGSS